MSDPTATGTMSQAITTVEGLPASTPAPVVQPVESLDPDFIALQSALADEAKERAGGTPQTSPSTEPAAQPAASTDPAAAAPRPKRQMVPKERFDELGGKLRTATDEVLYLRGALAAAQSGTTPPAPGAQPPANTSLVDGNGVRPISDADRAARMAQIQGLQAQKIVFADKFDNGEMSMREYAENAATIDGAIQGIREVDLAQYVLSSVPRPQAPPIAITDQQLLAQQMTDLTGKHPWVAVLGDGEIAFLQKSAIEEAAAMGKPFQAGPAETLRLRARIAELASKYAPDWYPGKDPRQILGMPPAPVAQTSSLPARPAQPALPASAARALATANLHPPDVNNMGGQGAGSGEISDDRILTMSDEEIGALPESIRARVLQGA